MLPEMALARALEKVFRDRQHDDSWLDLADRVITNMAGRATIIAKDEYDELVTELRERRTLGLVPPDAWD